MKLEVGKVYLTRSGMEVMIINECGAGTYPFVGRYGKSQFYFTDDGRFDNRETSSEFDLIGLAFNPNDAKEVVSFILSSVNLSDMELKGILQKVAT